MQKTAAIYYLQGLPDDQPISKKDFAASYQEAIVDTLISKLDLVINDKNIYNISIAGGVAANKRFRYKAMKLIEKINVNVIFPEIKYSTDNAAMIAMAGYNKYKNKEYSSFEISPYSSFNN